MHTDELHALVKENEGFIEIVSVGNTAGEGISISYWKSLEHIKIWKQQALHLEAQRLGSSKFYNYYQVEICEVMHEYSGGYSLVV